MPLFFRRKRGLPSSCRGDSRLPLSFPAFWQTERRLAGFIADPVDGLMDGWNFDEPAFQSEFSGEVEKNQANEDGKDALARYD
jgi:hypothetical protein